MKVTNDNNTQLKPGTTSEKQSTRGDLDALAGDDMELDGLSEKPSFASVLDRVTQSRKEPRAEHTEKRSDGPPVLPESKTKEKDEPEDAAAVAVPGRSLVPEPLANAEMKTDIRAMVPTGDLEKIVAACRVEVVGGGQHEVTLDLSHSVLEGLRVKVSADASGRVTTEFLAANDGIKSLLDARSPELIALLRSRGINLVNFKASVAADTNSGADSRSRRDQGSTIQSIQQNGAALSSNESEAESASDERAIGATYRA
jgi:hypothetical protein